MRQIYGNISDLLNADRLVIDTSVAVCLDVAGWTDEFIRSTTTQISTLTGEPQQLRISPTAYSESDREFRAHVTTALDIWDDLVTGNPDTVPVGFTGQELQDIQAIIKMSRHTGSKQKISRADAEGVYLAGLHNSVLLTGDNQQAQVANSIGVTAIHKFTILENIARNAALPILQLCAGLVRLIANSHSNHPCALSDHHRDALQEIHHHKCYT